MLENHSHGLDIGTHIVLAIDFKIVLGSVNTDLPNFILLVVSKGVSSFSTFKLEKKNSNSLGFPQK